MHTFSPYLGVLFGVSLIVSAAARAQGADDFSNMKPGTREALQGSADTEFRAAAKALRERLERADAGDAVGVAVADQALKAHRDRYLDLRRALARLNEGSSSAAAARNPFEPDFHASREGMVKRAPAARSAGWGLYARMVPQGRLSEGPSQGSKLTPSWGMYGSSTSQAFSPAPTTQPSEHAGSAAVRPFLVYRAPRLEGSAKPSTDF